MSRSISRGLGCSPGPVHSCEMTEPSNRAVDHSDGGPELSVPRGGTETACQIRFAVSHWPALEAKDSWRQLAAEWQQSSKQSSGQRQQRCSHTANAFSPTQNVRPGPQHTRSLDSSTYPYIAVTRSIPSHLPAQRTAPGHPQPLVPANASRTSTLPNPPPVV